MYVKFEKSLEKALNHVQDIPDHPNLAKLKEASVEDPTAPVPDLAEQSFMASARGSEHLNNLDHVSMQ